MVLSRADLPLRSNCRASLRLDPNMLWSSTRIRTSGGEKYIEYEDGFREFYDLDADRYELANSYDPAAPPVDLAARLEALKGCAGDGCRKAEDGP